jgi:hypothetical protein
VSFADLDGLPLLASFYCFELAPEAVDESWPNGFLPTCKLPPARPLFNFVSIDTRTIALSKNSPAGISILCQAFAPLTYRQSLRDIEACPSVSHSTTIDLCLSLFPWGGFRRDKSAMKLHTLLDLRGSIPTEVQLMRAAKSHFRDGEQEIQYGHGRLAPTHVSHGSDTDVRL